MVTHLMLCQIHRAQHAPTAVIVVALQVSRRLLPSLLVTRVWDVKGAATDPAILVSVLNVAAKAPLLVDRLVLSAAQQPPSAKNAWLY